MKTLQIKKLYVKFFEVEGSEIFGAIPTAKSQLTLNDYSKKWVIEEDSSLAATMTHLNIIPTVFIRNKVFYSLSKAGLDSLAKNMNHLIYKYFNAKFPNATSFNEIQIDCDWTTKTKENYFYLLTALKKYSTKNISCTLRLYPYSYPEIMGVPPVDRATLMCYNLLPPLESENKNSILDVRELEKYLKRKSDYPLNLDIALPAFSWMQVYQNNEFKRMINPGEFSLLGVLKPIKPLWYEVQKDTMVGDFFLRSGDKIKYEEITEALTLETIKLLKKYIPAHESMTLTLFHLDADNLKKYSNETLQNFYTSFSN